MTIRDKWLKLLMTDKAAIVDFYLYLNELRSLCQERLVQAETIDQVKRLQGSIITLDEILNFTKQEEEETQIQNEYLGENPNEPIQHQRTSIN